MKEDSAILTEKISLEPDNPQRLASLCGQVDEHLKQIERRLGIRIFNRGNSFQIIGEDTAVKTASTLLQRLYNETRKKETSITPDLVHLFISESQADAAQEPDQEASRVSLPADIPADLSIRTPKLLVKARGPNQRKYLSTILKNDINFGIGPAGTGKTFLAVACAVRALLKDEINRILLVRPAVEAGEKLGFLPGDLSQKIDPYLRPLYDALYEMLGFEQVSKLIERNIIEIAPLAFMRGRTLSDSYIILDESQNTTPEQMKMFLTRIGFGSTAVITGDLTQIDLPRGAPSGLKHVLDILHNVEGVGFTYFGSKDVVRHPLVQRIVDAYDRADSKTANSP